MGGLEVVPACSGRVGWGAEMRKRLPMDVQISDVDSVQLLDLAPVSADNPGQGEQGQCEHVFEKVWFFPRQVGAFNAENLQVHEEGADLAG